MWKFSGVVPHRRSCHIPSGRQLHLLLSRRLNNLYNNFSNPEGDLAKIKSAVVSEKALAPIAISFGIDKLLILGKGEESSGGRSKPAILADCMEAIIGAYYLDSGYKCAEKYVLEFIIPEINRTITNGVKDYKTQLQELYQKKTKSTPKYELVSKTGPDHDRTFTVSVILNDKKYGPASAKSKKEAEQMADWSRRSFPE